MYKLYSTNAPKTQVIEQLLVKDNEAVSVGELFKLSAGRLTKASGTDKPEFVSVGVREAGVNVFVPVVRIMETDIYETELNADGTALNIGDAVTVGEDGLTATATTEQGVFTLTDIIGTEVGSKVRGMFRR